MDAHVVYGTRLRPIVDPEEKRVRVELPHPEFMMSPLAQPAGRSKSKLTQSPSPSSGARRRSSAMRSIETRPITGSAAPRQRATPLFSSARG